MPPSGASATTAAGAVGAAVAKPVPPAPPTEGPHHGRRATDRPGFALASPEAFKPTVGFLAQLIFQDGFGGGAVPPESGAGTAAFRPAESDPLAAQRRHYQRVDAYRRTQSLATPFDAPAAEPAGGAKSVAAPSARVIKIDI